MIAVIDYGVGNLFSLTSSLKAVGAEAVVTSDPEIIKKADPYDTEEGCLSLLGGPRNCKRYKTIKVQWQTAEFQTLIKTFTGFPAQIIQHEVDHCDGVLI